MGCCYQVADVVRLSQPPTSCMTLPVLACPSPPASQRALDEDDSKTDFLPSIPSWLVGRFGCGEAGSWDYPTQGQLQARMIIVRNMLSTSMLLYISTIWGACVPGCIVVN